MLRARIITVLLRAILLVRRAITLLLRAAAIILRNGMRFIPAPGRLLGCFRCGLRFRGFRLRGCGRFLRLHLWRFFRRLRLRGRGHNRRRLFSLFSGGRRRNRFLLLHDGLCLRHILVVSSAGMRCMILIGVEQIAQALHALSLFTRFAFLLLLVKKFAFGMTH